MADRLKVGVEGLLSFRRTGIMDPVTDAWLKGVPDDLRTKLEAAKLLPENSIKTVGGLLEEYYRQTVGVKEPTTMVTQIQTRRVLIEYFGAGRPLSELTPLEAARWRSWMVETKKLAQATIARRVKQARQVWKKGREWGIVTTDNPFSAVRAGEMDNDARTAFVERAAIDKVLE